MRKILILAAAAVAGCAGPVLDAPIVYNIHQGTAYAGYYQQARSPMAVEVYGTPPDGASRQEVIAALRMPAKLGGGGVFEVPTPGRGARVVIAFAPASDMALCTGHPPGASAKNPTIVSAAYCYNNKALSGATLRSTKTDGPRDPHFEGDMRFLMLGLFSQPEFDHREMPTGPLFIRQ